MLHMTACLLSLLLVHSIPLDNLLSSTTHEFLHRFVRMADGSPFNVSTKMYRLATPDLCEPHFETISLPKDKDPKIIIYPPCTRIERCSGCSSADLLVCEPIETEMVSLMVLKFILPQQESTEYLLNGTEEVRVERHLKCHQLCRVKATDCNQDIHKYLQSDCRCVCKVRQTCASSKHIWRESKCMCECVQTKQCRGFASFNESTCECDLDMETGSNGKGKDKSLGNHDWYRKRDMA
ncbi:unnamed protein product [Mytilus coruscus]|uniref:Platelet-derived growth factor (PDGF) family profile domain-containing protein n=1 Tax=Mytilus coruscus TaxID=42192 RepID=A0A6J8A2V1_MYTCO|nr:unnamed protein product [Mytilus coruscus]